MKFLEIADMCLISDELEAFQNLIFLAMILIYCNSLICFRDLKSLKLYFSKEPIRLKINVLASKSF